jgi:cobalt-precorrin 5A hydrolase
MARHGMPPGDSGGIAAITLSTEGSLVGARIAEALPDCELYVHSTANCELPCHHFDRVIALTTDLFAKYMGLVYIMPAGVVVRAIAPHLQHKLKDPAVVVLDVGARWAVSLLSGHEGGANELAIRVANLVGAEPVVSTTTDALKDLIVGVGCRRGAPAKDITGAVRAVLADHHLPEERVRYLASVDLKANEPGLLKAATDLRIPLRLVAADEILATPRTDFKTFATPSKRVGLPGVAEPTALLAGRRTRLFIPRQIINSVTVAVAQEHLPWSESAPAAANTGPDKQKQ